LMPCSLIPVQGRWISEASSARTLSPREYAKAYWQQELYLPRRNIVVHASAPAILKPEEIRWNDRGGGARTLPLVTRACGSTSLINGITAFDPGAAIGLHKHNCEESVMVLEGHAIAEIDGVAHHLKPYGTTWIPAGVVHRFINASNCEPMRIFWIYASIDATRTMIDTGETRPIDAEHKVPVERT
jgi:putative monooxygenase